MRRTFVFPVLWLAGALVLASLYAAWPLWTAWSIRHAIKTGDAKYLETAIDWPPVRKSLRDSLTAMAFASTLAPASDPQAASSPSGSALPAKAGFWARFKAFAGAHAIDGMVEAYATPKGLPQLFAYARTWRETIRGEKDPDARLSGLERLRREWGRIKRAKFTSFTRFEIEAADKYAPEQHYEGVLELRGSAWQLTELRLKAAGRAPPSVVPAALEKNLP